MLLRIGERRSAVFVAEAAHASGGAFIAEAALNLAEVFAEVDFFQNDNVAVRRSLF